MSGTRQNDGDVHRFERRDNKKKVEQLLNDRENGIWNIYIYIKRVPAKDNRVTKLRAHSSGFFPLNLVYGFKFFFQVYFFGHYTQWIAQPIFKKFGQHYTLDINIKLN